MSAKNSSNFTRDVFIKLFLKYLYCNILGAIHVYLTLLPILGDSYLTRLAYLTSLREVRMVIN